jgi:hypothetical protein
MMKKLILIAAVFAVPYAFAQSSTIPSPHAARTMDEQKPSLGIKTGIANIEGDDDQSWDYGVEMAYQAYVPVSIAVELSGVSTQSDGPNPALSRTMLLGKGLYNFGGTTPVIRYSYVGGGVGPVYDNRNGKQDWNLGLAPQAGFDIPVNDREKVTLGANVAYTFVTGNNPDSLSANGVMKYWF